MQEVYVSPPREFAHLLPFERKAAINKWKYHRDRFDNLRPTQPEDNRRRALHLGYLAAAATWGGIPFAAVGIPGAVALSVAVVTGAIIPLILTIALGIVWLGLLSLTVARYIQAWKVYPKIVRTVPTIRHPDIFS